MSAPDSAADSVREEDAKAPLSVGGLPGDPATHRIVKGLLPFEVARFGGPLAVGMGLQTTFTLVDAFIVSRLDEELKGPALGALSQCDNLGALGPTLSYGLSIATAAIMSRRQVEGNTQAVRQVAWQSLLIVGALGLAFALLGILGAPWLVTGLMGAKGEVATLSIKYLRVIMGGGFTMFFLLHLTTIQRALGSAKTPVSMLIGANVLNFVLAVIMVYGPGPAPDVFAWGPPVAEFLHIPRMDLMGAAWSTLIARSIVLIPVVIVITKRFGLFKRLSRTRPDRIIIGRILSIGWPSSAQLVVRIIAMVITVRFVNWAFTTDTDQSATTAIGIVLRLETMAIFIGMGWGSAAQTFMGQNLGARLLGRAKRSGWYAALYNSIMMLAFALVLRWLDVDIVSIFDDSPQVLDTAVGYVNWVSPSYLFLGLGIVLGSAIQGAGATRQVMWLDIAVIALVQIPLGLFVVLSQLDESALWIVVALTNVIFALTYVVSYKRGRFLHTDV